MTSLLVTSLVAAGLLAGPLADPPVPDGRDGRIDPPAQVQNVRGECDRAVNEALAMTGGELLSVVPARNGRPICRVTVLVINKNGRPKKVKLKIPMDY